MVVDDNQQQEIRVNEEPQRLVLGKKPWLLEPGIYSVALRLEIGARPGKDMDVSKRVTNGSRDALPLDMAELVEDYMLDERRPSRELVQFLPLDLCRIVKSYESLEEPPMKNGYVSVQGPNNVFSHVFPMPPEWRGEPFSVHTIGMCSFSGLQFCDAHLRVHGDMCETIRSRSVSVFVVSATMTCIKVRCL